MRMMNRKSHVALLLALLAASASGAPRARAADGDDRWVAIQCGKLITGAGEEKEKVTLLIKNGKVELIGDKVELPFPCEVIDATKSVVMPGLIHAHSRLSLLEYQRNGMRADVKVADEFLPAPGAFDAALAAGFTTLQLVAPGTSGIPGRCMVVRTADGGEGLVVDDDGAVKVNLAIPMQDRRMLNDALNGAKKSIEAVEKARADFEAKKKAAEEQKKKEEEAKKQQAQAPQGQPGAPPQAPPQPAPQPKAGEPPKPEGAPAQGEAKKEETFQPPPIAPPLLPFVDLIQKKPGAFAFVKLGGATTYLHFLEATKDFDVAHVLYPEVTRASGWPQAFSGVPGTDLHWAAKQFGEHHELVVLAPFVSFEQGSIDLRNIPARMVEAGARLALTPASDAPDSLAAFRTQVADLVKCGLARADAIAAITKNAAEAIGAAGQLGTLEPGKEANVIVLSGDPLDVQSNLERVVIDGRVVWTRGAKARS